ncbi:hypothetical protein F5X96DRAFT_207318 [Biscogniauxia mediterranea]|nr:hypothetical protein F5X96DRAFT_207318 [Biscogniauxia mediterranea]
MMELSLVPFFSLVFLLSLLVVSTYHLDYPTYFYTSFTSYALTTGQIIFASGFFFIDIGSTSKGWELLSRRPIQNQYSLMCSSSDRIRKRKDS